MLVPHMGNEESSESVSSNTLFQEDISSPSKKSWSINNNNSVEWEEMHMSKKRKLSNNDKQEEEILQVRTNLKQHSFVTNLREERRTS